MDLQKKCISMRLRSIAFPRKTLKYANVFLSERKALKLFFFPHIYFFLYQNDALNVKMALARHLEEKDGSNYRYI